MLDQSLDGHSHELWATIAPTHLAGRTGFRPKVLWLDCCPFSTTGNQALPDYRRWPVQALYSLKEIFYFVLFFILFTFFKHTRSSNGRLLMTGSDQLRSLRKSLKQTRCTGLFPSWGCISIKDYCGEAEQIAVCKDILWPVKLSLSLTVSFKVPVFISCHSSEAGFSDTAPFESSLLLSVIPISLLVYQTELWFIITLLCYGFSVWDK